MSDYRKGQQSPVPIDRPSKGLHKKGSNRINRQQFIRFDPFSAFTFKLGEVRNGDRLRLRHVSRSIYGSTSFWIVLNNSFHVTTRSGRPADAPVVTVLAPADEATVQASRIIVSGIATDPDGVVSIEVTGTAVSSHRVVATSADGFATWEAELVPEKGARRKVPVFT
jgi:hypothetical protein